MDEKIKLHMIRNRAKALYHTCHSTACFKYADADAFADAEDQEGKTEGASLWREGQAYELAAQWIKGLIDII